MRLDEGRQLGDWKLIKEIGYGAIGHSFVAEHRFTKQKVVLKILPEDLASDRSFVMRFEDEALMLATLDHPAIAKIHTVSFIEGLYLLVVECVVDSRQEMKTLASLASEFKLSVRQIGAIGKQLADALDYAHSIKAAGAKSFSHGNIKPSNILIAAQGDDVSQEARVRVKISDFGLSRVVGQAAWLMRSYKAMIDKLYADEMKSSHGDRARSVFQVSSTTLAPSAAYSSALYSGPMGSVEAKVIEEMTARLSQNVMFLSPEQRRGDWSTPIESDIWSFGVLLYWLLTGSYPEGVWDTDDLSASSELLLLRSIIKSCLALNPKNRPKLLTPLFNQQIITPPMVLSHSVAGEEKRRQEQSAIDSMLNNDASKIRSSAAQLESSPASQSIQKEVYAEADREIKSAAAPSISSGAMHIFQSKPKVAQEALKNIKEYIPEKRDTKNIHPIESEMVAIPHGSYQRGSIHGCRDEMPRHEIRLNAFKIDIHPVTNEQFVRFLEVIGDEKDRRNHDLIRLRDSRIKKSGGKFVIERGYGKHPVAGITWYGANAYADWVGKRLPTEAEWEVACCGGVETHLYPTGEDIERSQANFFSSDTTPVMSYPPNGYGIYDMAGNVYEWCSDWYEYNYYDFSSMEPDNPRGPIQGVYRVLRGGCWKSLKEDLRCAKRHRNNPGAANGTYGFRCAINC